MIFYTAHCHLVLCFSRCFTLNSTNLYPKRFANYGLTFKTSLDLSVIGHPKLETFFCAFVYVNSLNPVTLFEWNEHFHLVTKPDVLWECRNWFKEFDTYVFKWQDMYQYNVYHHRYEFIDGK